MDGRSVPHQTSVAAQPLQKGLSRCCVCVCYFTHLLLFFGACLTFPSGCLLAVPFPEVCVGDAPGEVFSVS